MLAGVLALVYLVVPAGPGAESLRVIAPAIGVAAILFGVATYQPERTLPWATLAIALGLLAASTAVASTLYFSAARTFPSVADPFRLVAAGLFVATAMVLGHDTGCRETRDEQPRRTPTARHRRLQARPGDRGAHRARLAHFRRRYDRHARIGQGDHGCAGDGGRHRWREVRTKPGDRVSQGDVIATLEAEGAPALPPKERVEEEAAPSPGAGPAGTGSPSGVYKSIEVRIPDIGDYKDVPVIEVHVQAGAAIAVDEPLLTLESDKATMEVPAARAAPSAR